MPYIQWIPGLSVGVPSIDADHQAVIYMINDLHEALVREERHVVTDEALTHLLQKYQAHFKHEEELFFKTAYPDAAYHKSLHDFFPVQVQELKNKCLKDPKKDFAMELLIFLKQWIIDHLQSVDRGYIPYLKGMA